MKRSINKSIVLSADMLDRIESYMKENGLTSFAGLVRTAINEYLEKHTHPIPDSKPDSQQDSKQEPVNAKNNGISEQFRFDDINW